MSVVLEQGVLKILCAFLRMAVSLLKAAPCVELVFACSFYCYRGTARSLPLKVPNKGKQLGLQVTESS
jgi:hypothetical protein